MGRTVGIAQASASTLRKRIEERRRMAEESIEKGDYRTAEVHERTMQLYTMQLGKLKAK